MKKKKKIPLRKCIVCHNMKEKKELIRIVKDKDGDVKIDIIGKMNGRGAYLCKSIECVQKAKKAKHLNREFKTSVTDEVFEMLDNVLEGKSE